MDKETIRKLVERYNDRANKMEQELKNETDDYKRVVLRHKLITTRDIIIDLLHELQ